MRSLPVLLLLATGCATAPQEASPLSGLGNTLQTLRRNVTKMTGNNDSGSFAGPDGRPFLIDFRNAILRLPHTFRLDVPPFADNHAAVRLAEAERGYRPRSMLSRALAKIPW